MKDLVQCPYCKLDFHRSKLKDHIGHDHWDKLQSSLKGTKIALFCVVISFSVVIGMIYMGLIK